MLGEYVVEEVRILKGSGTLGLASMEVRLMPAASTTIGDKPVWISSPDVPHRILSIPDVHGLVNQRMSVGDALPGMALTYLVQAIAEELKRR